MTPERASLSYFDAAVPTSGPVHPLAKVLGAIQRHRLGELRAPAMLAPKARPKGSATQPWVLGLAL
jgi:hypothetical protein